MRIRAAYLTNKLIEERVKAAWNGDGYMAGQNDGTIAASVNAERDIPVSIHSVAHVRKHLGLRLRRIVVVAPPQDDGLLKDVHRRIIRVETKLHALAEALGVDIEPNPYVEQVR